MRIKSKKDIENMLNNFSEWADYDTMGKKHYLVFRDNQRDGLWTLMQYTDGLLTLHGRGDEYCDNGEKILNQKECLAFIWENRKSFNESLKKKATLV